MGRKNQLTARLTTAIASLAAAGVLGLGGIKLWQNFHPEQPQEESGPVMEMAVRMESAEVPFRIV